ncbi:cytochrome P450 [Kockovaella imperatae]|uniref:Cytochrome P450 n=1 Tax=Kockovaella imperatae TaxID=4999 RepID=A0A1Y1UMN3_9TREE|nr:cytochrome P450 [Kockovaella imperatae]ORX39321.1 cytochrome P450 [Kockovaella imperatae]
MDTVFGMARWAIAQPRQGWMGVSALAIVLVFLAIVSAGLFLFLRGALVPFRDLPGPAPDHWFYGSFKTLMASPSGAMVDKWTKQYGTTFRWTSIFRRPEIISLDPAVASYVWSHPDTFDRAQSSLTQFKELIGPSVLSSAGDEHKRMRRALLPAFSVAQMRNNLPIFWKKAYQFKDKLAQQIGEHGKDINPVKLLDQLTIDIIGRAGFNHEFNSLGDGQDELLKAFQRRQVANTVSGMVRMLQFTGVPVGRLFPNKTQRESQEAKRLSYKLSKEIYDRSVQAVAGDTDAKISKGDIVESDLISVLIKSNMASDVRSEQKMSAEEIIGNMFAFILAGNVTTSRTLVWALHVLSTRQDVQDNLRTELSRVPLDELELDELNELPYLEAFVRELLRLYTLVPMNVRQATKATTISLSRPIKGRSGKTIDTLRINKGTTVLLPLLNINTSTEFFGQDADTFRPERFLDRSKEGQSWSSVPGIYGNITTFTNGSHACLGYRFAMIEIKVVIFVLLRGFTINAVPGQSDVVRQGAIGISVPVVKGAKVPGLSFNIRPNVK